MMFFHFLVREIINFSNKLYLAILPLCYFFLGLFCYHFLFTNPVDIGFFWTIFLLSSACWIGNIIVPDQNSGMLAEINRVYPNIYLYLVAKTVAFLTILLIPNFFCYIATLYALNNPINWLATLLALLQISTAISSLYILIDTLICRAQSNQLIGIIIPIPFIIPSLIFTTYFLQTNNTTVLMTAISYTAFLSCCTTVLSYNILRNN